MRGEVERDLSASAHDFKRVVWPVISRWCRGGELHPVEAVTPAHFEKQLDILAGIDAWQVIHDVGVRGICSRVQWMPNRRDGSPGLWPSFTIRKRRTSGAETELSKRIKALSGGGGFIRPALVVQAYIAEPRRIGTLNYVCMCRADDLYKFAESRPRLLQDKVNPADGNEFSVVWVADLLKHGFYVKTWKRERAAAA